MDESSGAPHGTPDLPTPDDDDALRVRRNRRILRGVVTGAVVIALGVGGWAVRGEEVHNDAAVSAGSATERAASSAVDAMTTAAMDGDGERSCSYMTPALAASVASQGDGDCAEVIANDDYADVTIHEARDVGPGAVEVDASDEGGEDYTLSVIESGGRWLVDGQAT